MVSVDRGIDRYSLNTIINRFRCVYYGKCVDILSTYEQEKSVIYSVFCVQFSLQACLFSLV